MTAGLADTIGAIVGFLLTLMVVSYVLEDNFLFRLAIHIFIGVAAGYATVLVVYNVIVYQLIYPLREASLDNIYLIVPPVLLGIWLLVKSSPRLSGLGSPVVAFLAGIGAAAAIGGAVTGTIFPQVQASVNLMQTGSNILTGILILLGTVTTLAYFHFGVGEKGDQPAQRPHWLEITAKIGQGLIAVTFGALFAGVYLATLAALIERVSTIWNLIWTFLKPL